MDFKVCTPSQSSRLAVSEPMMGRLVFCPPSTRVKSVKPKSTDASIPLQRLVKRVFSTGLLSLDDEAQLRHLMTHSYCRETFKLLISLQSAAQSGIVIQASRHP